MKTMTKLVAAAFTAAAIFLGSNANAQTTGGGDSRNRVRFGIGVEALAPVGDLHDFSGFGLGGTARLQYDIQSSVSLMVTSGYYNFFSKNIGSVNPDDLGIVPVKAGAKFFFAPGWHVSAEAGAGFETSYAKNTKLILAPGIGYSSDSGFDVGLRYENFSGQGNSYGTVGLRLAYAFL